ncbi:hypothetical protein Q8W71_31855 [Methylobacterium sp. NEAU 140]|uniref:hypothetical protein n=1 Tax=Methylobacterium sp. NEAU 140 TaxID=3064945 RepID=UPI0027342BF9|nr:hypothetical protein [Methylobacterium sp. NEAU 140]MDP4027175.1 hypothetical protein [Methylobacterium sp. NEAU 140]
MSRSRLSEPQPSNRAKLGQVIGKEQADALIADLGNEATFARTRDVVTGRADSAAQSAADREIGGTPGMAGVIRSLLNLDIGDAWVAAGRKVTGGFADALRERRNADLARILTEVGPDREGARRAFAALGRSVRAKDISSDVARTLMNAAVRGGGQEELGRLAGLPARYERQADAEPQRYRDASPKLLVDANHEPVQPAHYRRKQGDADRSEPGLAGGGHAPEGDVKAVGLQGRPALQPAPRR